MPRVVIIILAIAISSYATRCQAASTNFEDLAIATQYAVGSGFGSGGIQFTVIPFPYSSYPLRIASYNYAQGGGNELWMGSGVGVAVGLPPLTSQVAFKFGQYYSRNGLIINGASSPQSSNIKNLNGTTLGGVSISVQYVGASGTATLTGAIQSLSLGGIEYAIDDLTITAPVTAANFNGDEQTDGADFLQWQRGFRTPNAAYAQGDADGDHDVDGSDLIAWRYHFGRPPTSEASTTAIPEPSAYLIAATGLLGLAFSRRRNEFKHILSNCANRTNG